MLFILFISYISFRNRMNDMEEGTYCTSIFAYFDIFLIIKNGLLLCFGWLKNRYLNKYVVVVV